MSYYKIPNKDECRYGLQFKTSLSMNYYKILSKDEYHYDLQYKTGLNVDPKPFNPSGNCEPGGIYFSREDILAFLDYGPWIRKVTLPKDALVYECRRR